MKKSKKTMPKSIINGKKNNNMSDITFLKELNGQVVVSVEQYKSAPDYFIGKPGDNLRLKDGREVVVACELEGMAFPLDKLADLLLNCILINHEAASAYVNSDFTVQAYPMLAGAYKLYCAIMDFLNPGHKRATLEFMRQFDKDLYSFLKVEGTVKYFDNISRREHEEPENPRFCFGHESIDEEYLAYMILNGIFGMQRIWQETPDATEDSKDFMFTLCMGSIMVTKLRRMEKKAAIKYAAKELGPDSKECVEIVLKMLTIDKKKVAG